MIEENPRLDWFAYLADLVEGECLCDEIDPSDRPCLRCEVEADMTAMAGTGRVGGDA